MSNIEVVKFTGEPGKGQPGLVVSCGVIDNGNILMAQRALTSTLGGGKWEFPGGKVEFMEKMGCTAVRELWEELRIIAIPDFSPLAFAEIIRDSRKGHETTAHWVSPFFECTLLYGTPVIQEPEKCMGVRWSLLEDIKEEELTSSAKQILPILKSRYPLGLPKY